MAFTLYKFRFLRAFNTENIRFAANSIRAQKLRSFLTLLGIVVGVASVIAMVSLVAGFNSSIDTAFSQFGSNVVRLRKFSPLYSAGGQTIPPEQRSRPNLTIDDAEALKQYLTLAKAVCRFRSLWWGSGVNVKNSTGDEAYNPEITGVTPEYAIVRNVEVEDGRFFAQADMYHATRTCVIGYDVVKALFPQKDPLGKQVYFDGVPLLVVGVLKKKGSVLGDNMDNLVYIPFTTFDEMWPWIRLARWDNLSIEILPHRAEDVPELIDEITTVMRARRGLKPSEPDNFGVESRESQLEKRRTIANGIAAVMILIASIALIVGGVGVMNIMLVSVTERTREIGVRKALGATRKDIAAQFLVEAVTLTGVGGIFGIGFGLGCGLLVKLVSGFPAAAPLWSIILGVMVSTGTGLAAGLWPALKAARQDPIEALRYE
ncbi:MAG: ABC transporter permease [Holophagales bacterium]|jgi:putative ABC transport system permease protein|nr:ABC transporter permease [Holophagales bacterium]